MITQGKEIRGLNQYFWKLSEFLSATTIGKFNYIAGSDGRIYQFKESELGHIVVPRDELLQLEPVQTGFQFNLPKIPTYLLSQIVSFFNSYIAEERSFEVTARVYYDFVGKNYFIYIPYQTVTEISAKADDDIRFDEERYLQVLQIHSHNSMPGYFSTKDDRDELAFMLYGVVGRLQNQSGILDFDMSLRVGLNGSFINLPVDYIFESKPVALVEYPNEWHKRVSLIR